MNEKINTSRKINTYVAVGDSFTEGMDDPYADGDPRGEYRGWADRVAEHLAVSPATVKTHVGQLIAKLDARDRSELVILAYETGLVLPAGQAAALHAPGRDR